MTHDNTRAHMTCERPVTSQIISHSCIFTPLFAEVLQISFHSALTLTKLKCKSNFREVTLNGNLSYQTHQRTNPQRGSQLKRHGRPLDMKNCYKNVLKKLMRANKFSDHRMLKYSVGLVSKVLGRQRKRVKQR